MKVKPGTFYCNGREYMAVSSIPQVTDLTASEVADAIAAGVVRVRVFSGCKAMSLADMFKLVNMKGAE